MCHPKKKKKICTKNNQIITHSQTIFRTNKNRQSINNYEWIETKLKNDQIRLTVCFSRVYGGMPWVAFERMRECVKWFCLNSIIYLHLVSGFYYTSGHVGPSTFSTHKHTSACCFGWQVNGETWVTDLILKFTFCFTLLKSVRFADGKPQWSGGKKNRFPSEKINRFWSMDDEAETYKLWRIRKTVMQVKLVASFELLASLRWTSFGA